MSSQENVKKILQYRLDNTPNVNLISDLADDLLNKNETEYVHEVCRVGFQKLLDLEAARIAREKRNKEIDVIRLKMNTLNEETRRHLETEMHLLRTLPDYLTFNLDTNQNIRYNLAEKMVNASLRKKTNAINKLVGLGRQDIDDEPMDKELVKTIDEAMKFLEAPPQMLQLCRVIVSAGYPRLALPIAEFAQTNLQVLKQKLKERTEIVVKRDLIEYESNRLKKVKKDLPKEMVEELNLLKQQVENFKMPFSGTLNAFDANALEQQSLQIALAMIACAVNYKKNLMDKKVQVIQKKQVYTKTEKAALDNPKSLDELIKKVLFWALEPGRVEDPNHMLQLAKNISDPDLDFVYTVGDKIRKRIKQLKEIANEKKGISKELDQLQDEREKLLAAWKLLPEDKKKRLYELEFQSDLEVTVVPNYFNATPASFNKLEQDVSKFMLDCIYDQKDKFEDQINNPTKYPMIAKLTDKEINKKRDWFNENVLKVVNDIQSPEMLFILAKHVQSRKDGQNVFKIGEKCQRIIKEIEELREIRAPIQGEINTLNASREDLLKRNRPFNQQDRLDELNQQLSKLPAWPEYADLFNHHQYDELNLDIVRVMSNAILDNKTALEESIAKMFRENAPENIDHKKIEHDRASIQQKIKDLTKQCLTKFSNPVYLMKFANDMKQRRETDIVLEVIDKCLQKIKELNEQRKIRKPIQIKLDNLELQKEEAIKSNKPFNGEEEIAELKKKLDDLPLWPHYAQVYKDHQYDNTVFQCIEVSIASVLDDKDALERQIAKQFYEDRTSVDHKKVAEDRARKQKLIDQVMKSCFANVFNPTHLQKLAEMVAGRGEITLLTKIARHAYVEMKKLEVLRSKRNTLQYQVNILQDEERQLAVRKKTLDEEAQADLDAFKKNLEKLTVPEYISTQEQHQKIKDSLAQLLVSSTFNKKAELKKKMETDHDMTDERKEYFNKTLSEAQQETADLLFEFVNNPNTLLTLTKDLRSRSEFEFALKIGERCYKLIVDVRKITDQRDKAEKELATLREEEDKLSKLMKYLPADKKASLRNLTLQESLFAEMPYFYQKSFDTDNLALQLSTQLITTCLEDQQAASKDNSMDTDEKDNKLKQLKANSARIVEMSLNHILSINNLLQLCEMLKSRNEYGHLITAAKKCQTRILEKRAEYQKRVDLQVEYDRLDNIRLQQVYKEEGKKKKSSASKKQEEEEREELNKKINEVKAELDALPKIDNFDAEVKKLNDQLLQTTELIISAATVENQQDEVKNQTIMAFKADTTTERWDRVRGIVSEEEWATVKEDLVVYVLKQNTNLKDKIELLLKDGLYKQVIEVFPKPGSEKGEIALLNKVYTTIDENQPELLEKMIPIISRYMKRYFQEQKYQQVYPLLDKFQRRFPSVLVNLLTHAVEMVLFDIMPSQYNKFVAMLKSFKQRLEKINRQDDWNTFFEKFKHDHAGKKKLIQMVGLVGDSLWDIESIMGKEKKEKKGGKKRERKDDDDGDDDDGESKRPAKKPRRASVRKTRASAKKKAVKAEDPPTEEMSESEEDY